MANHYTLTSFGLDLPRPAGNFLLVAADLWNDLPDMAEKKLLALGAEELAAIAAAVEAGRPEPEAIVTAIMAILDEIDKERMPLGLDLQWDEYNGETRIWGHSDESFFIEGTVSLVQETMIRFAVAGVFTIRWADTCSKPAYDEFGGGAVVFNATDATWIRLDPAIEAAEKALGTKPTPAPGL